MASVEKGRKRKKKKNNQQKTWPYTIAMGTVSTLIASVFALGAYVNASQNLYMAIFLGAVTAAFVFIPPWVMHKSIQSTSERRAISRKEEQDSTEAGAE